MTNKPTVKTLGKDPIWFVDMALEYSFCDGLIHAGWKICQGSGYQSI